MIAIKRLNSSDTDFATELDRLLAFEATQDEAIERTVAAILADVKARGDAAVIEYTQRFDGLQAHSMTANWKSRSRCCRLRWPSFPASSVRRSKQRPAACATTISGRRCIAGNMKKMARVRAVPCSARRSRRSTASASTCPAARLPTRRRC
jgi:hypothetical protein